MTTNTIGVDGNLTAYGVYQVTVSTTAHVLADLLAQSDTVSSSGAVGAVTGGIPPGARIVFVTPLAADILWCNTGAATSSFGEPIYACQKQPINTSLTAATFAAKTGTAVVSLRFEG